LLNNLKELIPKLLEHQVALNIITNGALMTPDVLETLLPHLHQLIFSIDSQKKEIFEMMRSPANFEDVTEKASHAVKRCREVGIEVGIHMVLVADNVPHLEGFVDYVVDELGGRNIIVLELLESTNDFATLDAIGVHGEEVVAEALTKMRVRAQERGVNLRLEVHEPFGAEYNFHDQPERINSAAVLDFMHVELAKSHLGFCPHVMHYLKVEPDGEAFPCCRGPRELRLGNVLKDGFDAVWNGKPAQRLRQQMIDGDIPKVCQGCSVLEAPKWFK
jgi:radical SAM protein with 4Fe4S-binding SPASM domain